MRRLTWLIIAAPALISATVALATPTFRLGPSPVSSVIYPEQEIRLDFDHALHLKRLALDCVDCHDLAPSSTSTSDILLPREGACVKCHAPATRRDGRGSSELREGCKRCHPRAEEIVKRSLVPPAHLRFSHADHDSESCQRCHTRVEVRDLATVDDLPGMRLCLSCHDGRRAPRHCRTCHLTRPDGRLRTELGGEPLLPPVWMHDIEHGPSWTQGHALAATGHIRLCHTCHQDHECLACHDGNVRPREVHPGDWLSVHGSEARAGELRCRSCHRGQSYCTTCHARSGVAWRSPPARAATTSSRIHRDPNWTASTAPTHGREARRALTTCVSCHAGRDCATCHAFVNPHPPGFQGRRCRSLVRAGSRACLECHDSAEGLCR